MSLDQRIRDAERRLFASEELQPEETFTEVAHPGASLRVRVLHVGAGPSVVLLHGVTLAAAIWAPWLRELAGYRLHLVELPGHGLSGPVTYRRGAVRDHSVAFVDGLLDALGLETAPVVGHSLGGMFALWHAAARPGRISSLIAIGEPAVALPGAAVRMPLSLMTVPVIGEAMLRCPAPRPLFRTLFGQGMSPAAAASAPPDLLDVLRLAARRPGNSSTVASLMHAINEFRRPRPESAMTDRELGQISVPVSVIIGRADPFLTPEQARPSIAKIPQAVLHEVPGGHGPWLESPDLCAELVIGHLTATGTPRRPEA